MSAGARRRIKTIPLTVGRSSNARAKNCNEWRKHFIGCGIAGDFPARWGGRPSAVDLARALISRFGSVRALLSAPSDELNAVRGIGPAKIAQLHAIGALTQRALAEELRSTASFDSPDVVRDYLKLLIGTRSYEVFVCLYLDARHCLIRAEESSHGTLTHTAVYPQKIARQALLCNAVALIVAHNHPSGNAEPSPSDFHLTKQLQAALALFDIRLLDHFVVSANSIMSFVEQKML